MPRQGTGDNSRLTPSRKTASYPQREAVLFALRELTGKDAGTATEAWLALFPRAELDAQAIALSTSLVQTTARRQAQLLAHFKSGQGEVYTVALRGRSPTSREQLRRRGETCSCSAYR